MPESAETSPTIIFDGVCNLCEDTVVFIIRRDRGGRFRFAQAQSPAGQALQQRYGADAMAQNTLLLIEHGQVYTKSEAAARIADGLDGAWKLLALIRLVPRPIRDWAYTRVANRRYRWFGRKAQCLVPTPEIAGRFL